MLRDVLFFYRSRIHTVRNNKATERLQYEQATIRAGKREVFVGESEGEEEGTNKRRVVISVTVMSTT